MKKLTAIVAMALMTGCTQMYFDKSAPVAKNPSQSQSHWHSNMVLSLIEVSPPVDLEAKCGEKGWESVKTETSFLNGLVGLVPYLGLIWTPQTVTVQCENYKSATL